MSRSRRDALKDQSGSYLPKICAIAYCVFDPEFGPTVLHQIPEGSVATNLSVFERRTTTAPNPSSAGGNSKEDSGTMGKDGGGGGVQGIGEGMVKETSVGGGTTTQVLFDFSSVMHYVIPQAALCGHLITKSTRSNKILGFPVRIENEKKYARNAFIFNLCFIFERDAELSCFEPVVRKTARILRAMEESTSLLSSPPPSFSMANLVEQIYLDITAYSETSIPLTTETSNPLTRTNDSHLDLILYPYYANPREVKNWDVPLSVSKLVEMANGSWDVTLFKICPFIDGINTVKRIAELAEVELKLARSCIQHLLFYSAVIMVDLFRFSNSYATLPGIVDIAQFGDEEAGVIDLQAECEVYVYSEDGDKPPLPFATLLRLYSSLVPSITLSTWIEENSLDEHPVDVRRMIQFGIIKGFLRRVWTFPVWVDHPDLVSGIGSIGIGVGIGGGGVGGVGGEGRRGRDAREGEGMGRPVSDRNDSSYVSSNQSLPPSSLPPSSIPNQQTDSNPPLPLPQSQQQSTSTTPTKHFYPVSLPLMLDGSKHTDEICLKYGISLRHLENVLRSIGGVEEVSGSGGEKEGGTRGFGRVVMLYV